VKVVNTLSTSSKPVPVAKFDAMIEIMVSPEHLNVEGLPILKFFLNGEGTAKDIFNSIKKCVLQLSALIADH
jgi:hypothetical protein